MGTLNKLSPKHLNRYVKEFDSKNDLRDLDTLDQMRDVFRRLVGHNLLLPRPHRRQRAAVGRATAEGTSLTNDSGDQASRPSDRAAQ